MCFEAVFSALLLVSFCLHTIAPLIRSQKFIGLFLYIV